jgi:hypothetical protein
MPTDYLHNHPEFADLIRIVAREKGIDPALVEKDYWIMHCLYGLQKLELKFELKGGTSLSKGHQIIKRFSEDIDIRIEPPPELHVKTKPSQKKHAHVESRRKFYDWLVEKIKIGGITKVARDIAFDNKILTSAGIRLSYDGLFPLPPDLKEGVVLEAGFDVVTPNQSKDIIVGVRLRRNEGRHHRQPRHERCVLRRRLYLRRKTPDGFHEISPATGEEGVTYRLHAALLRCVEPAPLPGGSSLCRHRGLRDSQGEPISRWRQSRHC